LALLSRWRRSKPLTPPGDAGGAQSTEVRMLHEQVELVVMPLVNVDGYEFSRLPDQRFHRKNRRPPPDYIPRFNEACWGVDLNRNFPQHYGGLDASVSPCDQNYR
jgi:murein tripeptide amidase MpaA